MELDQDACYRAISARDPRFDGEFFVGVTTTGVYCRPVCPARTPGPRRCRYFRTAAEAEKDGFRACFRCRPEVAPGGAPVDAVPRLVREATRRIDEGFLQEAPVAALARSLGVSARHLQRATLAELGATPVELAQSRRLALAKQLLQDSRLPLADVAFASGFRSVRRFNALFRARFGRAPGAVRRSEGSGVGSGIVLRLDARLPWDGATVLAFLAGRAIPGVEQVAGSTYRRTARIGDASGWIEVDVTPRGLLARVSLGLRAVLPAVVTRLRALFDLDARPAAIAAVLGRDRRLARALAANPGLRVPGAFDGLEVAVRALLGQQVSVRAASTLAGRLVARFGEAIETPHAGLDRLFPAAEALRGTAAIAAIGLPGARAAALEALAAAVGGGLLLERGADAERTMTKLVALPGIGDWTASYIAMRALGWPDACPSGDLVLRRALGDCTAREVERRAERWRPWRAYAVMHLWREAT